MRVPTLDAWNMMIQQQLSSSASLQIGYIGSHGIHNMFDSSNQANPNQQTLAGFNCSNAPDGCNLPIDPQPAYPTPRLNGIRITTAPRRRTWA